MHARACAYPPPCKSFGRVAQTIEGFNGPHLGAKLAVKAETRAKAYMETFHYFNHETSVL